MRETKENRGGRIDIRGKRGRKENQVSVSPSRGEAAEVMTAFGPERENWSPATKNAKNGKRRRKKREI